MHYLLDFLLCSATLRTQTQITIYQVERIQRQIPLKWMPIFIFHFFQMEKQRKQIAEPFKILGA